MIKLKLFCLSSAVLSIFFLSQHYFSPNAYIDKGYVRQIFNFILIFGNVDISLAAQ